MDWTPYGVRPTGDRKSRRFEVTSPEGVDIQGKHYDQGDTISHRQALNRKYNEDAGWESRSEYERESRTRRFREWASQVAGHNNRPTSEVRSGSSDFSAAWVDWKRSGFDRDPSAGGDFSDFLVDIDYRDEDADYDVGDTPNSE